MQLQRPQKNTVPENRKRLFTKLTRRKFAITLICVFFVLIVIYMGCEPYWIQVKEETRYFQDLPQAFDGMRVVFVSDLHADSQSDLDFAEKIVGQINELQGDVVLLGGDFADTEEYQQSLIDRLGKLRHGWGIFAVRGNHDEGSKEKFFSMMREAQITPGKNENFTIEREGESIVIATMDDYDIGETDINATAAGLSKDDFVFLLAHQPRSVEQLGQSGKASLIDAAAAGHTHGGQITLFGLYSPMAKRAAPAYTSQWTDCGGIETLFSNGVGQWFNLRFFARPQIHLITLRKS